MPRLLGCLPALGSESEEAAAAASDFPLGAWVCWPWSAWDACRAGRLLTRTTVPAGPVLPALSPGKATALLELVCVCSALHTRQPRPRRTGYSASERSDDSLFLTTGWLPGSPCSPGPWGGRQMPRTHGEACSRQCARSMYHICLEHHRATVLVPNPSPGFLVILEALWLHRVL